MNISKKFINFLTQFCYCMKLFWENAGEEFCTWSWEMRNAAQKCSTCTSKRHEVHPSWKIQLDIYCTQEWFRPLKLYKLCVVFRISVKSVFKNPQVKQWDTDLEQIWIFEYSKSYFLAHKLQADTCAHLPIWCSRFRTQLLVIEEFSKLFFFSYLIYYQPSKDRLVGYKWNAIIIQGSGSLTFGLQYLVSFVLSLYHPDYRMKLHLFLWLSQEWGGIGN